MEIKLSDLFGASGEDVNYTSALPMNDTRSRWFEAHDLMIPKWNSGSTSFIDHCCACGASFQEIERGDARTCKAQ